jgi:hypothetical protein
VALIEAMEAVTQGDADRLRATVRAAHPEALVRVAVRHRCAGALLRGLSTLGVPDPSGGAIVKRLQAAVRPAALQAFAIQSQLTTLVAGLAGADVPCVLLKGAARLHAGEDDAHWSPISDLDVLIRERDVGAAIAALKGLGYRANEVGGSEAWYRAHHHHLVPFEPPGAGLPVELHLVLGWPGAISQSFDWDRVAPYIQQLTGTAGTALCLNPTGTALHRALHGIDLRRLYDTVLLARCLRLGGRGTVEALDRMWQAERRQRVALQAVVALAARIAGIRWEMTPEARRYLAWTMRREEMPRYVRLRTGLVDAWFVNGGRLFGPASRLALPPCGTGGQRATPRDILRWGFQIAGLIAMGTCGALLAAASPDSDPA